MPLTEAPGFRFREFDFTQAARGVSETVAAVVGAATKGPVDTPTLVNSEQDLVRRFGPPVTNDYGLQAAVQYLRRGGSCYYVRVAGDSARTATAEITGLTGGSVAAPGEGDIELANAVPADEDTLTIDDGLISITFEFDSDSSLATASNQSVSIAAGDIPATMTNLISAINASPLDVSAQADPANDQKAIVTHNRNGSRGGSIASSFIVPGNVTVNTFSGGEAPAAATGFLLFENGNASDTDTITIGDGSTSISFEFDTGDGISGDTAVAIGSSTAASATNLRASINTSNLNIEAVDAPNHPSGNPAIRLVNLSAGTGGNVSITTSSNGTEPTEFGMEDGADATSPSTQAAVLTIRALNPGTFANNIELRVQSTTVSGAPAGNFDLLVLAPEDPTRLGARSLVERYNNLSLDPDSDRYITPIIDGTAEGVENPSQFIRVSSVTTGSQASAGTYILGTGGATAGHNGVAYNSNTGDTGLVDANGGFVTEPYVGSTSASSPRGLQTLEDPDTIRFNLAAVPGVSHDTVISDLITLAENRSDFLAIVDPPIGLSPDQVIDWHNGTLAGVPSVPNPPNNQLDTSFAGVFHSWVEVRDPYNKTDLFLPPSGFVLGNMAQTDKIRYPWFATAGHVRGVIQGSLSVETSPNKDAQARMLRNGNSVNPIVNFSDAGPTIFGNQTLQRRATILQQLHVRRLLVFLKNNIRDATDTLLFNPNDGTTQRQFTKRVSDIIESVKGNRGVEDFEVICDERNNPPETLRERKLNGAVLIKPFNAVERIQVDFALFDQGVEFNDEKIISAQT